MNVHLVFTSSYSSQLGSLISIKKYLSDYSENLATNVVLIFQIATLSDSKAKFSPYNLISNIREISSIKIIRIPVINIFSRILLWLLLPFIYPVSLLVKIFVWEPRVLWISSLFSFKGIKLPILLPRCTRILFGDGFLSYCADSKPFWLTEKHSHRFRENIKNNYYDLFYYLYNLSHQNTTCSDIKIPPNEIRLFISSFIDSCSSDSESMDRSMSKTFESTSRLRDLYIFPTTTFSESSRTTLGGEISMYIDFICQRVPVDKSYILIKPHPGTHDNKTSALKDRLVNLGYLIYDHTYDSHLNSLLSLPLNVIPLEILYLLLVKYQHIYFQDIYLTVCSTASLSCILIYPEIKWYLAFGSDLINKYIRPEYSNSRLVQESKLVQYLSKISEN